MFEGFSFTSYYVDKNIWEKLENELKEYKNILVVTGEKSYEAVKENLLKVLELKKYSITKYQGECSYEHADEIINFAKDKDFDLVLGVGGGKAIDTAKIVASKLKKIYLLCQLLHLLVQGHLLFLWFITMIKLLKSFVYMMHHLKKYL